MKSSAFAYERPKDISSVLVLLAEQGNQAKILAGGQSLGPMLNMRLVEPDVIIDITSIAELKLVEVENRHLILGSCVTHADIEDGRVPDVTKGAMREVASGIAYRAVRNRGTIGGSLTNADPSADWVSSLAALGAETVIKGPKGTRTLPAESYVSGALEAALHAGEMLAAIRVPKCSADANWGYYKVCRKTGEYAHAIGAVLLDRSRDVFRAVIGATESQPLTLTDARPWFRGSYELSKFDIRAADAALEAAGMSDGLDRKIHLVALERAVRKALNS
jgi:carbon-monoxide dehydrogenase medium subunit